MESDGEPQLCPGGSEKINLNDNASINQGAGDCANINEEAICIDVNSKENIEKLEVLEKPSFIYHLAINGDLIITAGKDHDIHIWDFTEKRRIFCLSGHKGPVTGIGLLSKRVLVSCSEDGSIRKWSLISGKEFQLLQTENVITCLGVVNKQLIAIGNNKGNLETYYIHIGKPHLSVVAHSDPIDHLMVKDSYVSTAVFDPLCSIKVFYVGRRKLVLVWNLDDVPALRPVDRNLTAFCLCGDVLLLGNDHAEFVIIHRSTGQLRSVSLHPRNTAGSAQTISVQEDIFITSSDGYKTYINVYKRYNFAHVRTFTLCDIERVSVIQCTRKENMGQLILGGSVLALLTYATKEAHKVQRFVNELHPLNPIIPTSIEGSDETSDSALSDLDKVDWNNYESKIPAFSEKDILHNLKSATKTTNVRKLYRKWKSLSAIDSTKKTKRIFYSFIQIPKELSRELTKNKHNVFSEIDGKNYIDLKLYQYVKDKHFENQKMFIHMNYNDVLINEHPYQESERNFLNQTSAIHAFEEGNKHIKTFQEAKSSIINNSQFMTENGISIKPSCLNEKTKVEVMRMDCNSIQIPESSTQKVKDSPDYLMENRKKNNIKKELCGKLALMIEPGKNKKLLKQKCKRKKNCIIL